VPADVDPGELRELVDSGLRALLERLWDEVDREIYEGTGAPPGIVLDPAIAEQLEKARAYGAAEEEWRRESRAYDPRAPQARSNYRDVPRRRPCGDVRRRN
jgi:hypothetical protein